MKRWKAQVQLKNGSSSHLQWVEEEAQNAYEARLAIESKYGRILQGPIQLDGNSSDGDWYSNW